MNKRYITIGNKKIGNDYPVYLVGEIGINHNGDISIAKKLIDVAAFSGLNAVKFQKRTPELCVPEDQRDIIRETPWGKMTYMEYRHRVEFGEKEYREIDRYCKEKNIDWFASCWDEPSVDFIDQFNPVCYKVASAGLTNDNLLNKYCSTGKPIILSTGMSTLNQIMHAVDVLGEKDLLITHCTSSYPCPPKELNLNMINTLQNLFNCPIGYSGHEVGLQTSYAAVVLGACLVERHITLDRAMWGSDQAASIEPQGVMRLVRDIRVIEEALGDGEKQVYESEKNMIKKLRNN